MSSKMNNPNSLTHNKSLQQSHQKSLSSAKEGLKDYRSMQKRRFQNETGSQQVDYQKRSTKRVKAKKAPILKRLQNKVKGFKEKIASHSNKKDSNGNTTSNTSEKQQSTNTGAGKRFHGGGVSTASSGNETSGNGYEDKTLQLRKGSQIYGFDDYQ